MKLSLFYRVVQPLAIGRLVLYFQSDGADKPTETEAYIAAGAIVACLAIDAFVAHPSMMGLMHIAMKLRVSCSALIYRKTLRLSRKALGLTTVGQLVNLLSNDVSKFDQGFLLCHFVWVGPIQTAVGTYMLYRTIGVSAFFGMAFLLSFIPLQSKVLEWKSKVPSFDIVLYSFPRQKDISIEA